VHYRELSRIIGNYLLYFAIILCIPFSVSIYFDFFQSSNYPTSSLEFLETIGACLVIATIFKLFGTKAKGQIFRRESILLVVVVWFITSIIAALPFYLTKTLEKPTDAYFEAMSGLTTTGSSVMYPKKYNEKDEEIPIIISSPHVPNKSYTFFGTITPIRNKDGVIIKEGLEAVSRSVLFWRSFLQWLGGMGIVVMFLTVLPALGVGGKLLYQMEITGPIKEAVAPRIKETASLLWKLYLGLTLLEIILLKIVNIKMPFYDAICLTLSNISTGGFSINSQSVGFYNSAPTEWIVLIFMILGSINFGLYFHIIRLKFYRIYSPEFSLFISSLIIGCFLIAFFLYGNPIYFFGKDSSTMHDTIRAAIFQSISAQTSTGFTTANYELWPFSTQMFMLILMYFGGMAGATCGGIKTTRFYILYKIIINIIEHIFRPDKVQKLKISKVEVDNSVAITSVAFFAVAILIAVFATILYTLNNVDPETSLGLSSCMLNNTGIAFRAASPTNSFAFLPDFSKLISCFWMVMGRLEFFAILLLFLPAFWRTSS
jgi:trk/ktr system potassium uptake protein